MFGFLILLVKRIRKITYPLQQVFFHKEITCFSRISLQVSLLSSCRWISTASFHVFHLTILFIQKIFIYFIESLLRLLFFVRSFLNVLPFSILSYNLVISWNSIVIFWVFFPLKLYYKIMIQFEAGWVGVNFDPQSWPKELNMHYSKGKLVVPSQSMLVEIYFTIYSLPY